MARDPWYKRFTTPNFIAGISILVMRSYIDFSEPGNMLILRYLASGVFMAMGVMVAYLYYQSKFGPEAGQKIFVKQSQLYPDELGLDPAGPEQKFEVTIGTYDTTRLFDLVKKITMTCTIGMAIHFYWEAPIPLLMLCISQPAQLYRHNLFKVHVMKKNPKLVRSLRRPWPKPPSSIPFGQNGFIGRQFKAYRDELEALSQEDDSVGPTQVNAGKMKKSKKTK